MQAQTAALFTNIINEVIFNINSSAPAFLKTVYGLGHRAICNFHSTSLTGLPPRAISFGCALVYFMNHKNKPLLVAGEEWFMSSKPRSPEDKHRNTFLRSEGAFFSSQLLYLYTNHPNKVAVLGDWGGTAPSLSKHGSAIHEMMLHNTCNISALTNLAYTSNRLLTA